MSGAAPAAGLLADVSASLVALGAVSVSTRRGTPAGAVAHLARPPGWWCAWVAPDVSWGGLRLFLDLPARARGIEHPWRSSWEIAQASLGLYSRWYSQRDPGRPPHEEGVLGSGLVLAEHAKRLRRLAEAGLFRVGWDGERLRAAFVGSPGPSAPAAELLEALQQLATTLQDQGPPRQRVGEVLPPRRPPAPRPAPTEVAALAQVQRAVATAAEPWSGTVEQTGRRVEARVSLARIVSEELSGRLWVSVEGEGEGRFAIPPLRARLRLRPQRGWLAQLRRLGEDVIGHPPLDDAFVIHVHGEALRRLLREHAGRLLRLAERGLALTAVDEDLRVTWEPVPAEELGAVIEDVLSLWTDAARQLGASEESVEEPGGPP